MIPLILAGLFGFFLGIEFHRFTHKGQVVVDPEGNYPDKVTMVFGDVLEIINKSRYSKEEKGRLIVAATEIMMDLEKVEPVKPKRRPSK